jgi:hypothetical protein
MKFTGLWVEIGFRDDNCEDEVFADGGGRASCPFGGYAANGGRLEEVPRRDEVVCVPLRGISWELYEMMISTMSSGSSGKRVTWPEPSRSILFFIRRIFECPGVVCWALVVEIFSQSHNMRWCRSICSPTESIAGF